MIEIVIAVAGVALVITLFTLAFHG